MPILIELIAKLYIQCPIGVGEANNIDIGTLHSAKVNAREQYVPPLKYFRNRAQWAAVQVKLCWSFHLATIHYFGVAYTWYSLFF